MVMAAKYVNASSKQVSEDSLRLGNPYAHFDANGNRAAIFPASLTSLRNEIAAQSAISDARMRHGNPYAFIDESGQLDAAVVSTTVERRKSNVSYSSRDEVIENKVRLLHKMLWQRRYELWPEGVPSDPVELLEPSKALELTGYDFVLEETLGVFRDKGVDVEVAGLIDREGRRVSVSRSFRPNVRRFTAAHELGHAVMHEGTLLHRDRPLDGTRFARETIEVEADRFAAYFLMPKNLVKKRFAKVFCVKDKFLASENALFAFGQEEIRKSVENCRTVRELARNLAKTNHYNGRAFPSLAEQFNVTIEAMAIRIEELELIELYEDDDLSGF
jgi:Zn-dependent peptidase ImmA (M78 family)